MQTTNRFNSRMGDKKLSLLLVLRVLTCWSSKEHPVKQSQIVEYINNCASQTVWCDRKTVARHLKVLREAGYRIEFCKGRGWYIETGRFDADECDILFDLISRSALSAEQKQSLTLKLAYQKYEI